MISTCALSEPPAVAGSRSCQITSPGSDNQPPTTAGGFGFPAPKRKSGRKPTGQRRRRPDKKVDYTERSEGRQTAGNAGSAHLKKWHGRPARDHAQDARATSNRATIGMPDALVPNLLFLNVSTVSKI